MDEKHTAEARDRLEAMRAKLRPFGLDNSIAVEALSEVPKCIPGTLPLEAFGTIDFIFDLRYNTPRWIIEQARRSALLDIDPGRLQLALRGKAYPPPPHDLLFTIGEKVAGTPQQCFDGTKRSWIFTPPCVHLGEWPVVQETPNSPWTTVGHWWGGWMVDENGEDFSDAKRDGFLPFMNVPTLVSAKFELALNVEDPREVRHIETYGFRVQDAHVVAADPLLYRSYVQSAAGEFSASRPSCVRLGAGWISDRTLCFLASGKPCIVQDTGPNRLLSESNGLYRFTDMEGALRCFDHVLADYSVESRAAHLLAQEHFDAERVCRRVLSHAF